ncbi:Ca2+-binding EF-hand superfamily protein, partial [Piptocephalis cylindrospora]
SRDILSVEEEGEIAEAFDLFDSDGDGCVDFYELRVTFRAVGEELSRKELNVLLRTKSPYGTQIATREDYLPEARRRLLRRSPVNVHQTAFRLFTGSDQQCGVTDMDLRRVANELGVVVSNDEIAAMMDEFDVDRDG